jgi:hypothetical protein
MAKSEEVRAADKLLNDIKKGILNGSIKPANLDQAQSVRICGD